jgi:hypothetical protein
MDVISIWDELSYLDGILFTIWLGIMYFGKCYIDNYFKDKSEKCCSKKESKKDKRKLLNG